MVFFYCHYNSLETLKFLPSEVKLDFNCDNNSSLKDMQKISDFKTILKYKSALELESKLTSNLELKTVSEVKRKL